MIKKPELLAPAGDYSRLVYAVLYGADAVYVGGEMFSLRTASANFSKEDLKEGIRFAHEHNVRVYVACNSISHENELELFPEYIQYLASVGADAVIVTDLGTLSLVRQYAPDMEIHISTQASTVNSEACKMWYSLGAKRIVVARELSLDEIADIRRKIPADLELEAFAHGAMCMAHSGRCLLSDFLTGRSANRGNCAQPCRWKYAVCEETREGEYFPIEETDTGTFIFNSKDMCMIDHIPDMVKAGINSLKIEGRAKTEFYVATVTQAYRRAIDDCFTDVTMYTDNIDDYLEEVSKISHRQYYTGFYYGRQDGQNRSDSSYIRDYELIAAVDKYDYRRKILTVYQRNKFTVGETCEVLQPGKEPYEIVIGKMYDENGEFIMSAPHAGMKVEIELENPVGSYAFIRRRRL